MGHGAGQFRRRQGTFRFESSLGPLLSLSFPTCQREMLISSLLHAGPEDSPSRVDSTEPSAQAWQLLFWSP